MGRSLMRRSMRLGRRTHRWRKRRRCRHRRFIVIVRVRKITVGAVRLWRSFAVQSEIVEAVGLLPIGDAIKRRVAVIQRLLMPERVFRFIRIGIAVASAKCGSHVTAGKRSRLRRQ